MQYNEKMNNYEKTNLEVLTPNNGGLIDIFNDGSLFLPTRPGIIPDKYQKESSWLFNLLVSKVYAADIIAQAKVRKETGQDISEIVEYGEIEAKFKS